MNLTELLNDKSIKAKVKTETLSKWLLKDSENISPLIEFAESTKDSVKATCIEAIEFATKTNPAIAKINCLNFVSKTLTEKAPRIKWESAKVVGNIAHLYPTKLNEAIKNLLKNTEHAGTVVRWSAAFALGQIIKIKSSLNKTLIPAAEAICKREEKNSIKKIYTEAIKKSAK
ncbi:MAG: HEAT repeat domain-containing protein [Bacteroidia bacterium]|nr:HEAT repeat domain-containing protein [Bacteroidia bacterium]